MFTYFIDKSFEDALRHLHQFNKSLDHVSSFTLDRVCQHNFYPLEGGAIISRFGLNFGENARDVDMLCLILRENSIIRHFTINAELITTQRQTEDIRHFLERNNNIQSLTVVGSDKAKNRFLLELIFDPEGNPEIDMDVLPDIETAFDFFCEDKFLVLLGPQGLFDLAKAMITAEKSIFFEIIVHRNRTGRLARHILLEVFRQLGHGRMMEPHSHKAIFINPRRGDVQVDIMIALQAFLYNPECCARSRVIMNPNPDMNNIDNEDYLVLGEIGCEFRGKHYQLGAPGCWTFMFECNVLGLPESEAHRADEIAELMQYFAPAELGMPFIHNNMLQITKISVFSDIDKWLDQHWDTFYEVLGSSFDGNNGNNNQPQQDPEKKYPLSGAAQKLLKTLDNNTALLEIQIETDNERYPSLHRNAEVFQEWAQFIMWRNRCDWHQFNDDEKQNRSCNRMFESVEMVLDSEMSDSNKLSAIFSVMMANPLVLLPDKKNICLSTDASIKENNELP